MSELKLEQIGHPDAASNSLTFDSDGTLATTTGFSSGGLKVKSSGGGTFSINPPSSASDRTLVLPDEAGTMLTSASDLSGVTGVPTSGRIAFYARKTATQSIPNDTYTKITFDATRANTGNAFSTSNNEFTVPSGEGGDYIFGFGTRYETDDDFRAVILYLYVNSSRVNSTWAYNLYYDSLSSTHLTTLAEGDVVSLYARQNRGSALNIGSYDNGDVTFLWGAKIS